jgi:membrane-bound serine protease (ClpP class)
MNFFLDPNIAYLLLVVGLLLILLAIITPGTGLLEVGAAFCLILAGYAVYNLSFNLWALILLVLSIIPFLLAIRQKRRELFLALSIVLLIAGSVFLFQGESGGPAVNPWLASITSILVAGFLWFVTQKTLQAIQSKPAHDLDRLIGQIGEAKTKIHEEGSVQVAGELWSACSDSVIPAGSQIRVVERVGFMLKVEKEH